MITLDGPVLVGVNGSRHSRAALLWAVEHTAGQPPCAVTAWQQTLDSSGGAHDNRADALRAQSLDLDEVARLLPYAPVPDRRLVAGPPGPALVQASRSAAALVLGAGRVRSPGVPGVVGTPAYCLAHALCPVLVVPPVEYLLLVPYAWADPAVSPPRREAASTATRSAFRRA